jgi:Holliday junction resolvase RusA-like endonuclease
MLHVPPWKRGTTLAAKKARKLIPVVTQGKFGLSNDARREVDCVTLFLPLPPSSNHLFANSEGGGRHKTEAYDQWLSDAGWCIQQQRPGRIAGAYSLELEIPRPSSKRAMDLSNRIKATEDLLVKMRVISDDSLAERIVTTWGTPGSDVKVTLTRWQAAA